MERLLISAAVQAHPARAEMAEALAAALEGEVVYDPDPDAAMKSAWRTYRRALDLTPAWATHRLIVQDDGILCAHFNEVLPKVIAARPDRMIALFVPGTPAQSLQAVMRACQADEPFAILPATWVPAIALVWPVGLIEPGLAWVDKQRWPEKFNADDEIIGRMMRTGLRERVIATVPSLVEHPDVVPSLFGRREARAGRDRARVAACMIPDECDAREIKWC